METAITELPRDTSSPLLTKTASDCSVSAENIRLLSEKGFTQLQQTVGRNNINAGDALVAFNRQDGTDKTILTQYFCLAITMLDMNRHGLNEIDDGIFEKLFNFVVSEYSKKL